MGDTETMESASTERRTLSLVEKTILGACVVGVIAAVAVAFSTADMAFLDAHMFEVIGDAWNDNATIGLIVALVTAAAVGVFVIILSKATIASKHQDDEAA